MEQDEPTRPDSLAERRAEVRAQRQKTLETLLARETLPGLTEIGRAIGVTKQRAQQILKEEALHGDWKERYDAQVAKERAAAVTQRETMEAARAKHIARAELLSLFKYREREVARRTDWVFEKIAAYQHAHPRTELSDDQLLTVFTEYRSAGRTGRKIRNKELAAAVGCALSTIGDVLKTVGLESLCRSKMQRSTPAQREALRVAASLPLSSPDLAYFFGLKADMVHAFYEKHPRPMKIPKLFRQGHAVLTHRLASQIYELRDVGFPPSEISRGLPADPALVNYALRNRAAIKEPIIAALRLLDPNAKLPYRTANLAPSRRAGNVEAAGAESHTAHSSKLYIGSP